MGGPGCDDGENTSNPGNTTQSTEKTSAGSLIEEIQLAVSTQAFPGLDADVHKGPLHWLLRSGPSSARRGVRLSRADDQLSAAELRKAYAGDGAGYPDDQLTASQLRARYARPFAVEDEIPVSHYAHPNALSHSSTPSALGLPGSAQHDGQSDDADDDDDWEQVESTGPYTAAVVPTLHPIPARDATMGSAENVNTVQRRLESVAEEELAASGRVHATTREMSDEANSGEQEWQPGPAHLPKNVELLDIHRSAKNAVELEASERQVVSVDACDATHGLAVDESATAEVPEVEADATEVQLFPAARLGGDGESSEDWNAEDEQRAGAAAPQSLQATFAQMNEMFERVEAEAEAQALASANAETVERQRAMELSLSLSMSALASEATNRSRAVNHRARTSPGAGSTLRQSRQGAGEQPPSGIPVFEHDDSSLIVPAASVSDLGQEDVDPDAPEGAARWFSEDVQVFPHHLRIPHIAGVGSHIPPPSVLSARLVEPDKDSLPQPLGRKVSSALLREMSVSWKFFGGSDWQGRSATRAGRTGLARAHAESTDEADMSQSLFFSVEQAEARSARQAPGSVSTEAAAADATSAASKRQLDRAFEVTLSRMSGMVDAYSGRVDDDDGVFGVGESEARMISSGSIAVRDIVVLDHVKSSPIQRVVGHWESDSQHPRESGSSMIRIGFEGIQWSGPVEARAANNASGAPTPPLIEAHSITPTEFRIRAALLPLRANFDQDTLELMRDVADFVSQDDKNEKDEDGAGTREAAEEPMAVGSLFETVDIRAFKLKLDYWPKRVDFQGLRDGRALEALNLFAFEGLEIVLRQIHGSSIIGVPALVNGVLSSWIEDIRNRQLHRMIRGVSIPPLNTIAAVGDGISNLVLLPVQQYARDGRLMHGARQGAQSFARTLTLEALSAGAKMGYTALHLLDHASDIVSNQSQGGASGEAASGRVARTSAGSDLRLLQRDTRRRHLQPRSTSEGLAHAVDSLGASVRSAGQMIVAIPLEELGRTGPTGAVKSVIRAVPVAVLRPIIGSVEAVTHTVVGMRNELDPDSRREHEAKYKAL